MSYKRYCLYALLITILLPCNAVFNYVFNPYEIFTHNLAPKGIHHVQRYEKIEYLKTHHNNFNAYLIGSSRIGFIEPKVAESYLLDSKFYNAWLSGANPLDAEVFLQYLIEKNYPIKYAIIQIGLDHATNIVDYRTANDMQRIWHYDVTHKSAIEFYALYLFNFFPRAVYGKFNKVILGYNELPHFEDIRTGIWGYTIREKQRKQDPQAYVTNEPTFHRDIPTPQDSISKHSLILLKQTLHNINALCAKHHITCIIYTAPIHHNTIKLFSPQVRDSILALMAESFPNGFWHFGYLNSITTNDYNYYEEPHHIPDIDTLILDRIFQQDIDSIPKDFGIFINKENFKQSLKTMHEIESHFDKNMPTQHHPTPPK